MTSQHTYSAGAQRSCTSCGMPLRLTDPPTHLHRGRQVVVHEVVQVAGVHGARPKQPLQCALRQVRLPGVVGWGLGQAV